jgi:hypothetical protein
MMSNGGVKAGDDVLRTLQDETYEGCALGEHNHAGIKRQARE